MTSIEPQTSLFDLSSGPVCQKCKSEIGDASSVKAAGFTWHASGCFTCSFCSADISEYFIEKYSRIFCIPCEKILFGKYCGEKVGDTTKNEIGCNKLITDEFLEANERLFHPNCLRCSKCKRKSSQVGELFIFNDMFFCAPCTRTLKK